MIALASTTRVRRPLRDLTVSVATLGGTGTASFLATADHPTGAEATIGVIVEVTEGLVEIAASASMTSYLLRSAKQTVSGKILRENLQNDPQTLTLISARRPRDVDVVNSDLKGGNRRSQV
jgi:hypothetical protein